MPQWLWILIGILLVIALVIFIVAHLDVHTKGALDAMALLPVWGSKRARLHQG